MELKQIKELMGAMGRSGIKKLTIKDEGYELQLERDDGVERVNYQPPSFLEQEHSRHYVAPLPPAEMHLSHHVTPGHPVLNAPSEPDNSRYITSPMVGTFYAAPSPDDPAFVKVDDQVKEGGVVCIIEAMKVMNEVKGTMSGRIAEVLVESGDPVEFGTKLFRVV
ncbi:MAG: acetyl-CoA carboxylase biotin carboxyl carrier protein [Parachlamydiales bacterium]|nr:acetyl-CoA carboxylase biotin carboxyl carrier protein [Parachlamydiales bacterium]